MNKTKAAVNDPIKHKADARTQDMKAGKLKATAARSDSQVRYFGGSRGGRLLSSLDDSEGWCSLDFPLLDVRELVRS